MAMELHRKPAAYNWGQAANAQGGGPGHHNSYIATPTGPVSKDASQFLGDIGNNYDPRHQPFDPKMIKQVDLGELLKANSNEL